MFPILRKITFHNYVSNQNTESGENQTNGNGNNTSNMPTECQHAFCNWDTVKQATCKEDCLKIDLASHRGIEGEDVIWARGLPGKDAPESSGKLIVKTAIRLIEKERAL
jgi:hypothetical protein